MLSILDELENARLVLEKWTGIKQSGFVPDAWKQQVKDVTAVQVSPLKVIAAYLSIGPDHLYYLLQHDKLPQFIDTLQKMDPTWNPTLPLRELWVKANIISSLVTYLNLQDVPTSKWQQMLNEFTNSLATVSKKAE